jgi:hypothetical protein
MPQLVHRHIPRLILTTVLAAGISIAQSNKLTINTDETQLSINGRVLLEAQRDGFLSVKDMRPSPTGAHIAVIACGFECNDNMGFLFNADGTGKRRFTGRWDSILQTKLEWSADGRWLFYFRINSSAADVPRGAPPEGWVEIDMRNFRKTVATHRELKAEASYAVFNVFDTGFLNVRRTAGGGAPVVGTIPAGSAGIRVTGRSVRLGRERWVPIRHEGLAGWVNQRYLYEVSKPAK